MCLYLQPSKSPPPPPPLLPLPLPLPLPFPLPPPPLGPPPLSDKTSPTSRHLQPCHHYLLTGYPCPQPPHVRTPTPPNPPALPNQPRFSLTTTPTHHRQSSTSCSPRSLSPTNYYYTTTTSSSSSSSAAILPPAPSPISAISIPRRASAIISRPSSTSASFSRHHHPRIFTHHPTSPSPSRPHSPTMPVALPQQTLVVDRRPKRPTSDSDSDRPAMSSRARAAGLAAERERLARLNASPASSAPHSRASSRTRAERPCREKHSAPAPHAHSHSHSYSHSHSHAPATAAPRDDRHFYTTEEEDYNSDASVTSEGDLNPDAAFLRAILRQNRFISARPKPTVTCSPQSTSSSTTGAYTARPVDSRPHSSSSTSPVPRHAHVGHESGAGIPGSGTVSPPSSSVAGNVGAREFVDVRTPRTAPRGAGSGPGPEEWERQQERLKERMKERPRTAVSQRY